MTDMSTGVNGSVEGRVVAAVRRDIPDGEVRVSLTAEGARVTERLGPQWVAAVVRPLLLAFHGRRVEAILVQADVEPMQPGAETTATQTGSAYVDGSALGQVSVAPHEQTDASVVLRRIRVPSWNLVEDDGAFAFIAPTDRVRRLAGAVYARAYDRAPVVLDAWRQNRNSSTAARLATMSPRAGALSSAGPPPLRQAEGRPAVWLAMHWLESGGAESWAFRSAELARDAGYEVVITTDRSAPQRDLDRALLITPHVYLASNALAEPDWGEFFRGVLARHRVVLLHIHHSARAYAFLPDLRHLYQGIRVLDSTHIIEHRTGGFVRQSVEYSSLVDDHHVISPELRDRYVLDCGIPATKVHYHPLTDATEPAPRAGRAWAGERPLTVGFLGRLAPQKRPFLFVELVRRLAAARPGAFRFVMQGSGSLGRHVDHQIARSGLGDVVERRAWGPVEDFLRDVDVLVISSDNEGLTLTSIEADRSGVLVLSADVGSQATVVARSMLVPRPPRAFLAAAATALTRLVVDPSGFARILAEQHALLASLGARETATSFMTSYLQRLQEH